MRQYAENDLTINGTRIHYYRGGDGREPFILMHGATDNGLCWSRVADWLAAKYNVIMPDAQGHGKSDRLSADSRTADQAAHMAGLIKQLGLTKPLVMGHSMGAGGAVSLAVEYPDLPGAIILEDPAWREPESGPETPEMQKIRAEMFRSLSALSGKSPAEALAEGRKSNPTWVDEDLEPWARAKTQFDPNLFKNMSQPGPGYRELVPRINCPTLLITAENGIVAADTARRAEKLWQSRYPFRWVRIKGAGHNIRREKPEEFKQAVEQFLNEINR